MERAKAPRQGVGARRRAACVADGSKLRLAGKYLRVFGKTCENTEKLACRRKECARASPKEEYPRVSACAADGSKLRLAERKNLCVTERNVCAFH